MSPLRRKTLFTAKESCKLRHPANVEEVANVAREVGAEVLRGPLTYPSETSGLQLGDLDLSKYLHKYRDCEITLVIAATGKGRLCAASADLLWTR